VTEVIRSLEENLRKQIDCYRQLTRLEKEKQRALVNNIIEEIETITAQEEKILLEVARLEEERLYQAEFFAQKTGKKIEEITLADLVISFPVLDPVRKEFEDIITEIKSLHETNIKLLENAVSLVNFTISLLTTERQTTYGNPADKDKKARNATLNMLDRSV